MRGTRAMRNSSEAVWGGGGAWVGGARKRIEFMTKGNFVSARARPSRLKFN